MKPADLERISQKVGHCGPAVVAMLASFFAETLTQEEIARAAGVENTVAEEGTRPDQLQMALAHLRPDLSLLGKYESDLADLVEVTDRLGLPVGVEWQGRFIDPQGKLFDVGHFSLVTAVDHGKRTIKIIDPDDASAFASGCVSIEEFLPRWWEDNDVRTGDVDVRVRGRGLAFVVVPKQKVNELVDLGFEVLTTTLFLRSCEPVETTPENSRKREGNDGAK